MGGAEGADEQEALLPQHHPATAEKDILPFSEASNKFLHDILAPSPGPLVLCK